MSSPSQRHFGSSLAWNFQAGDTAQSWDDTKGEVDNDSIFAMADRYFRNMREQQGSLHGSSHELVGNTSIETAFSWTATLELSAGHGWPIAYSQRALDAPVAGTSTPPLSQLVGPFAASRAEGYGGSFNDEMQDSSIQLINGHNLRASLPSEATGTFSPLVFEPTSVDERATHLAMEGAGASGVHNGVSICSADANSQTAFYQEYADTQNTLTDPHSSFGYTPQLRPEASIPCAVHGWNTSNSSELTLLMYTQNQNMAIPTSNSNPLVGGDPSTQSIPLPTPWSGTADSGYISISTEIPEIQNLTEKTNAEEPALSPEPADAPALQSIHGHDTADAQTGEKAHGRTTYIPSSSTSKKKTAVSKNKKGGNRKTRSPAAKKRVDPKDVLPIKSKASKKTASLECEVCGKKCSHIRSLQKHEELHERTPGTQPECPNCKGKLSRPDALVRHVKNLYEKDPDNECVKMAQRLGWRYKVRGTGKNLLKGLGHGEDQTRARSS